MLAVLNTILQNWVYSKWVYHIIDVHVPILSVASVAWVASSLHRQISIYFTNRTKDWQFQYFKWGLPHLSVPPFPHNFSESRISNPPFDVLFYEWFWLQFNLALSKHSILKSDGFMIMIFSWCVLICSMIFFGGLHNPFLLDLTIPVAFGVAMARLPYGSDRKKTDSDLGRLRTKHKVEATWRHQKQRFVLMSTWTLPLWDAI